MYLNFIKKYAIDRSLVNLYLLTFIIIIITSLVSFIVPKLQGEIIDILSKKNNIQSHIFYTISIFIICMIISYVLRYTKIYVAQVISEKIALKLRASMQKKINKISTNFFISGSFETIQSKFDKNIESIKAVGINSIITLISNIILLLVIIPSMYKIDKLITTVNIGILIFVPIISKKIGKKIQVETLKTIKNYEDMIDVLIDTFKNWKAIRIFNLNTNLEDEFDKKIRRYKDSTLKKSKYFIYNNVITLLLQLIGISVIWLRGASLVINGSITVGTIIALMNYQSIITAPILDISDFYNKFNESISSLDNLNSFLYYDNEEKSNIKELKHDLICNICLENVCYKTSNKDILQNINYKFSKGNIYAITGLSGAGKSTLLDLISKFKIPTEGSIYIDEDNLNEVNSYSYWTKVSYMEQIPNLYKNLIPKGLTEKEEKKWIDIFKYIGFIEDKLEAEDAFEEFYNREGLNYSGGEVKKIIFMRNYMKSGQIFILDEPTSGIDDKFKANILKLIKEMGKNKIIIISTHDKKEMAIADVILNITDGGLYEVKS
ncbi:ABC transporter transmembrane domain-containing protein [Anaerococcus hydrogenalis]|uniref:ABC transporter transmembrane domain-containing protein n=1 Tax=Anaerococcus hydrogenalis TaxID=33029 RepID=UPI0034C6B232